MKIGVISDTHIPDRCDHIPAVILEAFKHVDMVLHAGDLANLDALKELESVCPKVFVVCGNMDSKEVAKKYPLKQVIEVSGFKIGLMHGYGHPQNLVSVLKDAFKNDNCNIIVFGHSHKPMNENSEGVLFFNPGTATDFSAECNSYGILEINDAIDAKIIKI